MTQGAKTELANSKRNYSKAQRKALTDAEEKILNKNKDLKPKFTRPLDLKNLVDRAIKDIFNEYVKLNPQLTIDESQLLTELADYQYQYNQYTSAIHRLSIDDEKRIDYEKRQQNASKWVSQRLKELNIMRISRLAEAQAEAKLIVEQQKADNMKKSDENEDTAELLKLLKESE